MEDVYFFLYPEDFDFVQSLPTIGGYDFRHPQINWVWSTYFRLKQKGYKNVHLIKELPQRGIVVMASNQRYLFKRFPSELLVILTVADSPPWFYSHINVAQNPVQPGDYPNVLNFPQWTFIPHWPQPNLLPRDEARGDRFENVAFLGDRSQLAPELLSEEFSKEVEKMCLRFSIIDKEFNDYRSLDAVLAVRRFSSDRHIHKPASKLVNAWAAGVPLIAGAESAFTSIQRSALDFLPVANKEEVLQALRRLKENPELRKQMATNGKSRFKDYSEEAVLQMWEQLLFNDAQNLYKKWRRKNSLSRGLFYSDMFLSRSVRSVKKRIFKTAKTA